MRVSFGKLLDNFHIYLASVIACLGSFAIGICIGWTSPVMPILRLPSENNPLDSKVDTAVEGWISCTLAIGAIMGCLVAGAIAARIGRKGALLLSSLVFSAAFVTLSLATNIWYIYSGRILQGIATGFVCTTIPLYVGEITTDASRGPAGCFNSLLLNLGILYVYGVGSFVNYVTLQLCCLAVPIVYFVAFIFMPETPYFLAMKDRTPSGIESLEFLRNQSGKVVEDEMVRIKSEVDADMANKGTIVDILHNPANRKAFFICCGLTALQELCGIDAIHFNIESIFISAKSYLDPSLASIITVIFPIPVSILAPFIIEQAGRKTILIISCAGMLLSLLALGTFFYVQAFGDPSNILWIPIPALIVFLIMYSIGCSPVPWIVLSEILPSNIKSTVSSFATTVNWGSTFVVVLCYPQLNALGPYYAFWLFGLLCALGICFVWFFVIETKGLSLVKIQEKLHDKRVDSQS